MTACLCCNGTGLELEDPYADLRERLIAAGVAITDDDRVMLKAVAHAFGIAEWRLKNRRRGCGGQRGRPIPLSEVAALLVHF